MKQEQFGKSVCIFDFDGTLVDSMAGFANLAALLISQSYQVPKEEARKAYLQTSGLPFREQLEVMFPQDPRNTKVSEIFERRKKEGYWAVPFFEEVPQTIRKLQARGVRTVISSNNGQEVVEQYIEKNQIKDCFDLVLGYRPGFSKGPDHFQKILEHFEIGAEQAVFVGDSLHDAKKASAFGMDFVGRVGTFARDNFQKDFPDASLVEDFSDLTEVVCKSSS